MIALQLCSCCPLASLPRGALVDCGIVNSQILAQADANAKFRENKTLAKWRNHSVDY